MKKYSIRQALSDSEHYKFFLLTLFRASVIRKLLLIVFFPAALLSILNALTSEFGSHIKGMPTNVIVCLIFPVVILLLLTIGPFFAIKFNKKEPVIYEFTAWGMIILDNGKKLNFPWDEISAYTELLNVILIKIHNKNAVEYILPKNGFKNNAELTEFLDFLSENGLKRK